MRRRNVWKLGNRLARSDVKREGLRDFFLSANSLKTRANTELIAKFGFKRLPSRFNLTLEGPDRSMKCLLTERPYD